MSGITRFDQLFKKAGSKGQYSYSRKRDVRNADEVVAVVRSLGNATTFTGHAAGSHNHFEYPPGLDGAPVMTRGRIDGVQEAVQHDSIAMNGCSLDQLLAVCMGNSKRGSIQNVLKRLMAAASDCVDMSTTLFFRLIDKYTLDVTTDDIYALLESHYQQAWSPQNEMSDASDEMPDEMPSRFELQISLLDDSRAYTSGLQHGAVPAYCKEGEGGSDSWRGGSCARQHEACL